MAHVLYAIPQVERPSLTAGFARGPWESESPEQWEGLIGLWAPFLGLQGDRLFDLSPNGHPGILSGGIWDTTTEQALAHDTVTDSTSFGDSSLFLPLGAITILLDYHKRDATNRQSGAFGIAVEGAGTTLCGVHLPYSDGTVYWDYGGNGGINRVSVGGLTFDRDLWAFTNGPRGLEIWQNGIRRALSATPATRTSNTNAWLLGFHGGFGSDLANYHEVRLYGYQWPEAMLGQLVSREWARGIYRLRHRAIWVVSTLTAPPQFARPSADTTRDNWEDHTGGTTTIYQMLDETVADHADYIRTPLSPTSDIFVTKLSPVTDPISASGHIIRYYYGKDSTGGQQIDQTIQLRQDYVNESSLGTLIAEAVHTNVGVFPILGTLTLSGTEADNVSDYSNLYIRIIGNAP